MGILKKNQSILAPFLFILGLLLILNPEISRGIINISAHTSDTAIYDNYCALPSVPAKLSENNSRFNRNNCIDRRIEQTSRDVTYFAVPNQLRQNRDFISSNYFSIDRRCLRPFQQTCQLLDLPPPSCRFA